MIYTKNNIKWWLNTYWQHSLLKRQCGKWWTHLTRLSSHRSSKWIPNLIRDTGWIPLWHRGVTGKCWMLRSPTRSAPWLMGPSAATFKMSWPLKFNTLAIWITMISWCKWIKKCRSRRPNWLKKRNMWPVMLAYRHLNAHFGSYSSSSPMMSTRAVG
jgi:hypothetical protein